MLNDSDAVEYGQILASPSFCLRDGMPAVGMATSATQTDVTGERLDYAERNGN